MPFAILGIQHLEVHVYYELSPFGNNYPKTTAVCDAFVYATYIIGTFHYHRIIS